MESKCVHDSHSARGRELKKQTVLWHVILFCHVTIVMCDLCVYITQNGNEREKRESGDKDREQLKHPVYAAQI